MGCVKIICTAALPCLLILIIIITIRTLTVSVRSDKVADCQPTDTDFIKLDDIKLKRFQNGLKIPTVSKDVGVYDRQALAKIQNLIKTEYKALHSSPLVKLDIVSNYSFLYKIQGSNTSLTPYLLASHLDVVPVEEDKWDYLPFGAEIHNEFIYARGAIDVKVGVFGILEALEYLLENGFKPSRTIYVGFGHDEEVSGYDGAAFISRKLVEHGVKKLEFIVDEGLNIVDGLVPGINKPVALIGSAEKGQVVLRLKVKGQPGHSSMPPKESALTILASAIYRLEMNPHPIMFGTGPEKEMFVHLSSEMSLPLRIVCSNLWLFGPIIARILSMKASTNAVVRTVTSVTQFNSGIKDNVIPSEAEAIINHRIHPAQSVQQVIDYDRYIINDDRVTMEIKSSIEPSMISPTDDDSFGYQMVKNSIRQAFPNVVVAPGVMIGNTDTLHYWKFTKSIYRFTPSSMFPEDLPRFHGNNERISIKNYEQAINFYYHLIKNTDSGFKLSHKHTEEL